MLIVDQVTKRYGTTVAVHRASFTAAPGRILGLLGPNGAGKTTTIRMIAAILLPDEGRILLEGRPVGPWSQALMGYLPEERGLYRKLKVEEQLVYFGRLKGLSLSEAQRQARHWLERLGLARWRHHKTEALSKGMQQKLQFIAAIQHQPRLLILDEPFSGLDPLNAELLRDIVLELKEAGRIILFASHRMEQVEQLCDDICLIARGRILIAGSLREVKQRFGRNTVVLEFDGDDDFLDPLLQEGAVRLLNRTNHRVELILNNGTPPRRVLEAALRHVREVYRFEVTEPPLTEIFKQVVRTQSASTETSHG
ncbi:ABC transporter ATP-binding protein [Rhodothermus profundi]|uniref:ABC-2 type transport system ATP-binding protein n=1 Tax=Rhodothermus profundi TaxID=633813 RepID=A0A1M6RWY3_9BACT|nr:ATP-binding cassette domain-containing protein [Rhodothermus profundi]SHK36961.1 ABC-2 type transport system ATP-binding protein [Rhodothermus profundi]